MTTISPTTAPHRPRARLSRVDLWYLGALVVGAVLIVWACVNQPYNQNELQQMAPYGSSDLGRITSGTRQPPLDPLLGAMAQHLLGEGQLRQRLVPALAGVGTLATVAVLLRSLRLGGAGALALWVLATAPLMVRYSAYTRPYALPLLLMVLFVLGGHRWLEGRSRAGLAVAAVCAVLLPLARVPEPLAFLVTTAVVLAWWSRRGLLPWSRTAPLAGVAAGAAVLVGLPMAAVLATEAQGVFDPSPAGVLERVDDGVAEIVTGLLPLLAAWLPWWPVTLAVVTTAVAVPRARGLLLRWWWFWPLLAAPVAFALAFHFVNPTPFEVLPYRSRAAYFFVVPYAVVVAAVAAALVRSVEWPSRVRAGVASLLGAALVTPLPATVSVLRSNDAPDFAQAATVIDARVPPRGIVLYDRPASAPQPRAQFLGRGRYLEADAPAVLEISDIAEHPRRLAPHRPVYLLINGQCTVPGPCTPESSATWAGPVDGWRLAAAFDRFAFYAPADGEPSRADVADALASLGEALGPSVGYVETFAAAALLDLQHRPGEARALVARMFATARPRVDESIESTVRNTGAERHVPFAVSPEEDS